MQTGTLTQLYVYRNIVCRTSILFSHKWHSATYRFSKKIWVHARRNQQAQSFAEAPVILAIEALFALHDSGDGREGGYAFQGAATPHNFQIRLAMITGALWPVAACLLVR